MEQFPVGPELIPLLQGLKPFLKPEGQKTADGLIRMTEFLTSSQGRGALEGLNGLVASSRQTLLEAINNKKLRSVDIEMTGASGQNSSSQSKGLRLPCGLRKNRRG